MRRMAIPHPLRSFFAVRLRQRTLLLVFWLLLFAGIILGAVVSRGMDGLTMQRLDFIFRTNFALRCTQGWFSSFVSAFASGGIFLLVLFLLGLSVWGSCFAAVVPFFKGYGYGLAVGHLVAAYGVRGFFYNLLIILPGMFVSALVLTAGAELSFKNSLRLAGLFTRGPVRDDPRELMGDYLHAMLGCLLLCALSAVLEMLCALCFSGIFQF